MSVEDIVFNKLKTYSEVENEKNSINTKSSHLCINDCISAMDATKNNYAFRHIYSCRKVIGRAIVFCKRVLRKLLKWYVEPICFQQTEFNNAATTAINILKGSTDLCLQESTDYYNEGKQKLLLLSQNVEGLDNKIKELGTIYNEAQELKQEIEKLNLIVEELQKTVTINRSSIEQLADGMECIRRIDESIFDKANDDFFEKVSTAQSGEDSIIAYVLMHLGYEGEKVTYLDIGANHAKYLSNTYYFYKKGARGVLVEANPELIPELRLLRNRDIVLNYCVTAKDDGDVPFYILNADGLSSFDYNVVNNALTVNSSLAVKQTLMIKSKTIRSIFEEFFTESPTILNIDIEGCELEVLRSCDFETFRPLVICVEMIPYEAKMTINKKNTKILNYLIENDYIEYAFTGINSIFIDKRRVN